MEIESIINRRPLTAISASSLDYEAIMPAHILYPDAISHSSAILVENASNDDAERMRCSWRRAQARVNAFWRAWRRDYITLLHNRSKWRTMRRDIAVGDLVLLVDENEDGESDFHQRNRRSYPESGSAPSGWKNRAER